MEELLSAGVYSRMAAVQETLQCLPKRILEVLKELTAIFVLRGEYLRFGILVGMQLWRVSV